MDPRHLQPKRFDCDPNATGSDKEFKHWIRTFNNFVKSAVTVSTTTSGTNDGTTVATTDAATVDATDHNLILLTNHLSATVFEYIADCTTYKEAIDTLTRIYVKPINEIYARYKLASRRQGESENLDTFIQELHRLSKDCNFKAVNAEEHRQGYVRDAFVSGIRSKDIRQKLIENASQNASLSMDQIFQQARTLQMAQKNAESYTNSSFTAVASTYSQQIPITANNHQTFVHSEDVQLESDASLAAVYQQNDEDCYHCGHPRHQSRSQCPARRHKCRLCGKTGHWERVCMSTNRPPQQRQQQQQQQQQQQPQQPQQRQQQQHCRNVTAAIWPTLATTSEAANGNKTNAFCNIKIKSSKIKALIDTGSLSCSFIDKKLAQRMKLCIIPAVGEVSLANATVTSKVEGQCFVDFKLQNRHYDNVKLYVLDNLCAQVILGQDFMEQHNSVVFKFGGDKPSLIVSSVSALTTMNVPPPRLFEHLTPDCKPVAVRSRKQTPDNKKFISDEIKHLQKEGIIVPSTSPWRAQVLVTKESATHKKRMVVDYKQTINRFTELDAYPLPDSEEMVRNISRYSWFSTFDLKRAYYQVAIHEDDRPYRAFEADGALWEFTRIPFGVTNGVAKFQRNIDMIVEKEGLSATFPFLDNVTICGHTEAELKSNETKFLEVTAKYNLKLNESKTVSNVQCIPIIGYLVSHGEIKPDPERLQP